MEVGAEAGGISDTYVIPVGTVITLSFLTLSFPTSPFLAKIIIMCDYIFGHTDFRQ